MFLTKEFEKVDKLTIKDFKKYIDQVADSEQDHYKKLSKQYISYLEVVREWEWFEENYVSGKKKGEVNKDTKIKV